MRFEKETFNFFCLYWDRRLYIDPNFLSFPFSKIPWKVCLYLLSPIFLLPFFFFFFFYFFFWSLVDLQCCANLCCTAKRLSYTHVDILFLYSFPLWFITGFFKYKFILFILFLAALGLRCCAQSFSSCGERGYSSLWCTGFSLRWLLLLWSKGSRRVGFSSCGTRAQ